MAAVRFIFSGQGQLQTLPSLIPVTNIYEYFLKILVTNKMITKLSEYVLDPDQDLVWNHNVDPDPYQNVSWIICNKNMMVRKLF